MSVECKLDFPPALSNVLRQGRKKWELLLSIREFGGNLRANGTLVGSTRRKRRDTAHKIIANSAVTGANVPQQKPFAQKFVKNGVLTTNRAVDPGVSKPAKVASASVTNRRKPAKPADGRPLLSQQSKTAPQVVNGRPKSKIKPHPRKLKPGQAPAQGLPQRQGLTRKEKRAIKQMGPQEAAQLIARYSVK